jgi:outer membrane protein TolC
MEQTWLPRFYTPFCAGLILLVCSVSFSFAAEPFTLRQALILGLKNNFDLRISNLNLPAADSVVAREASNFDIQTEATFSLLDRKTPLATASPDLFLESRSMQGEVALSKQFMFGTTTRFGVQAGQNDADLYANRLDPAYRATLVLDLTQPLLQDLGSGVNAANMKIAKARRSQVAIGYLDSAQQLVENIEQTYLELSLFAAVYDYRNQSRELAAKLLNANRRKMDAGLIPITEVNQADTALAGREEALIVAQQQFEVALNRLRDLIEHGEAGLISDQPKLDPLFAAEMAPPKLDEALSIALQSRPDLNQARLELEASRTELVYAKNKLLPRLDLQASLNVNGLAGDDSTGAWQGNMGNAFGSAVDRDGTEWSIGLQFKYPLGNRSARAQKLAADASQNQALYNFHRLEVAAETEIKNALVAIQRGQERLVVSERFVELAETTLAQETQRSQEGLSDSFRILTFQDDLIEAKIRRATARTDYRKGFALLYKAMGQNLERYDITALLPSRGVE